MNSRKKWRFWVSNLLRDEGKYANTPEILAKRIEELLSRGTALEDISVILEWRDDE